MSPTYQYQLNGQISEPVGFQVLVDRVREEKLAAGDLVKAEWEENWHPAAELVGLFYMAQRSDLLKIWEEEQAEKRRLEQEQALRLQAAREGLLDDSSLDELLLQAEDLGEELSEEELQREEAVGRHLQGRIARVMQEALSLANLKDLSRNPGRIRQILGELVSSRALRIYFVVGVPLVTMNLVGWGLIRWSDYEASRFPSRNRDLPSHYLPVLGRCTESEFWMGLGNSVALTGIISLGIASFLERRADG